MRDHGHVADQRRISLRLSFGHLDRGAPVHLGHLKKEGGDD